MMHPAVEMITRTVIESPLSIHRQVLEHSCDVTSKECVGSSSGFSVDVGSLQFSDDAGRQSLESDKYYIGENGESGNQLIASVTLATTVECAASIEQRVCHKSNKDLVLHLTNHGRRVDGSSAKIDHQQLPCDKNADVEDDGSRESAVLNAISYSNDNPSTDLMNYRLNRPPSDRIDDIDINANIKLVPQHDTSKELQNALSSPPLIPVPCYYLQETVVSSEMTHNFAQFVHTESETESAISNTLSPAGGLSTVTRYTCPLCPLSYKRLADLNRHMRQKHGANLRDAMRWRSMMLDHCNWIFTGPSVEPIDLSTKKASVNRKSSSATVVDNYEPLDLSTRNRKYAFPRRPRKSGRSGSNHLINPALLHSGESAKSFSFQQYPSSVGVELPRSTSLIPNDNAPHENAPCQSETAKTCVRPNDCKLNCAAELSDDGVDFTYVTNSNSAEVSPSITDDCQGTSKFEVFDSNNVRRDPKKCQNTTAETKRRCFVCCLPLNEADNVLCCYCATSNFDWQNHVRNELLDPLAPLTETGHSKDNADETILVSLSTVCCNSRPVEEIVTDDDQIDAACLLPDSMAGSAGRMRRDVLGEDLMPAIMNNNGTECLILEHSATLTADSFTSCGSDILVAPVNHVFGRYETTDEMAAAGAGVVVNKLHVVPVDGQRLQSSDGGTEKKNVSQVTNDSGNSKRLRNCGSSHADYASTKCGSYGRDVNSNWSPQSIDYLNTSPGKDCGTGSTDGREDSIFSRANAINGHMNIDINMDDSTMTPVKCLLNKESVEQYKQSQMSWGPPSLDNSVKMAVPEFQLSASSWTVSSRVRITVCLRQVGHLIIRFVCLS